MTTTAIPTSSEELNAMLEDSAKMQDLYKNPKEFGEFIKNYAAAQKAKDDTVAEQVRDQVQLVMRDWLADQDAAPSTKADLKVNGRSAKNALYNEGAPGTALDGLFRNGADFTRALYAHRRGYDRGGDSEYRTQLDQIKKVQNSFGSTIPADGGFLIPEVLRSQLLAIALETSVVRPLATVIPMESLRVPIPMVDSTTNATSVFGGVIAYWGEESASLTESQASFGRVNLDAKKLTAYAQVPNELLQDASAFGGFFNAAFPTAIAWYEDIAFMKGSGAGEPLGWLNADAMVTSAAVSGQGANTLVWENIVGMYARMLPASLNSAYWVASIDTFPQLATMALSVGTGGSAIWLNNGQEGRPMTILGRPVIFTEKMQTLGTAGDIAFVDMSYYLIGDRMAMEASVSPHYRFANDQTAYRFIERVDGRPWLQSAITPQNGGNTLSPFVQLSGTRT